MLHSRITRLLVMAYILALGFTQPLSLPGFAAKASFAEIIFVPLMIAFLWSLQQKTIRLRLTWMDLALLLLVVIHFISTLLHAGIQKIEPSITLLYLFLVYLVIKEGLISKLFSVRWLQLAILASVLLTTFIAITGWVLSQTGHINLLVSSADCYFLFAPELMQAKAFMTTPNMLMNFLGMGFILFLSNKDRIKLKPPHFHLVLFILALGIIVTFSKSIPFLLIALLILLLLSGSGKKRKDQWMIVSCCLLLFSTSMFMTHFVTTKNPDRMLAIQEDQSCFGKKPVAEIGQQKIFPTNYTFNKEAAFLAFVNAPLLGIGPGMFNAFVDQLKKEGLYPSYFVSFDPHSTYLGTLAETGITGFLLLMLIVTMIYKYSRNLLLTSGDQCQKIGMVCIFLFFFLEAFNMDILNFRHLWVMLGLLSGMYWLEKKNSK